MAKTLQTVTVASCDDPKCNVTRAAKDPHTEPDGFAITTVVTADGGATTFTVEAFACKETHVGPAVRGVIAEQKWDTDDIGDETDDADGADGAVSDDSDEDDEDDDHLVDEADEAPALNGVATR